MISRKLVVRALACSAIAAAMSGCGAAGDIAGNVTSGKVNHDMNNQINQPAGTQATQALPLSVAAANPVPQAPPPATPVTTNGNGAITPAY